MTNWRKVVNVPSILDPRCAPLMVGAAFQLMLTPWMAPVFMLALMQGAAQQASRTDKR
jgi:hypothetical protein